MSLSTKGCALHHYLTNHSPRRARGSVQGGRLEILILDRRLAVRLGHCIAMENLVLTGNPGLTCRRRKKKCDETRPSCKYPLKDTSRGSMTMTLHSQPLSMTVYYHSRITACYTQGDLKPNHTFYDSGSLVEHH